MIPCDFFTGHKPTAVLLVLRMKHPTTPTLKAAHSSIVVMATFSSPSTTIAAYNKVKPAMMIIENEIASL